MSATVATDSSSPEAQGATADTTAAPARKSGGIKRLIFPIFLLIAAAAGGRYYLVHHGLEDTDDAQIDTDVVAVPARIGGLVTAIHFADNATVKEGQLLAEIDDAPAKAKLAQAEAELASERASAAAADADAQLAAVNANGQKGYAQASLFGASVGVTATSEQIAEAQASLGVAVTTFDKAKIDLDRMIALVASGAATKSQLDDAQATYDKASGSVTQQKARIASLKANTAEAQAKVSEASAKLSQANTVDAQIAEAKAKADVAHARVATRQAERDLAALDLSYTKVYAPRAGVISRRSINVGQLASVGQAIVMIVPTQDVWVTANYKETQLAHMRLGQAAEIEIDTFDGRKIKGTVESFSGATGARFSLLPPDNATGNFTKVVQRVPVRIHITEPPTDLVLRPGMSVDVVVDTRK